MAVDAMTARLLIGDARERIREIPDGTIDLICTSPPFLALRKYGDNADAEMGSEANPAAFIDALLDLTAQFRRVLAPHGSIAIELGDTYSGSGGAGGDYNDGGLRDGQAKFDGSARRTRTNNLYNTENRYSDEWNKGNTAGKPLPGVAMNAGNGWPLAKSLAGIPEAFMLSLAYGYNVLNRHAPDSPAGRWRVRNVIVWARPNPPVGALGDKVRPATSYITIACASDKRFFDLDAVREPHKFPDATHTVGNVSATRGDFGQPDKRIENNPAGAPPLDWWEDNDPTGHATLVLPTQPYPGPHFAVWPSTLAKRLIEMMCPLRVCTVCGEPSRRIVGDAEYVKPDGRPHDFHGDGFETNDSLANRRKVTGSDNGNMTRSAPTIGWTDCGHDAWRQGHVLDPFAGSGTTLAVAQGCGRDATGIELYPANANLIADRLGMFLDVVT